MKLLIAGTRTITETKIFDACIRQIVTKKGKTFRLNGKKIDLVITGGASGIDALAHRWAKGNNLDTRVVKPDWDTHGKAAGPLRNADMVSMLSAGDAVVVIWDGKSKGARSTINLTRRSKRKLYLFQKPDLRWELMETKKEAYSLLENMQ